MHVRIHMYVWMYIYMLYVHRCAVCTTAGTWSNLTITTGSLAATDRQEGSGLPHSLAPDVLAGAGEGVCAEFCSPRPSAASRLRAVGRTASCTDVRAEGCHATHVFLSPALYMAGP